MVRTQLAEHAGLGRVCPGCRAALRVKDRRPRRLQTLFGTLEVEAPRLKACPCRGAVGGPGATASPVRELPRGARCTPELERVQAELGARASFREAARILAWPRCCRSGRPTTPACAPAPTPSGGGSRPRLRRPRRRTDQPGRRSWTRWTAPTCGPPRGTGPATSR